MSKIFLIEQLTADEKDFEQSSPSIQSRDYSIVGMTPHFEHAVALCSRNNRCNISEWEYDEALLQYRYKRAYNCNGELVEC